MHNVYLCPVVLVREILLFTLYPFVLLELLTSMCYFPEKIVFIRVLRRKFLENEPWFSLSGVIIVKQQMCSVLSKLP